MTRLLVDTTFLIASERGTDQLADAMGYDDDIAIAAISIAELRVGALMAKGKRQQNRAAYLDDIIATIPILAYDVDVAAAHAELLVAVRSQGRPRGAHDLIIAATAQATGRTVLTADRRGFAGLPGVQVRHPLTEGEQALANGANWGPAEDWSDWSDTELTPSSRCSS